MSIANFVRNVRGVPLPKVPWFPEKNINDAFDYLPHDGDVIICSYLKTGTTWLQYIVQQIMSKGDTLPNFQDLYMKVVPFIEMAGIETVEALQEPRIYKHHFSQSAIPIRDNAKYLYIYRNPEDVFISYYHFFAHVVGEQLTIDEFMDSFIEGNVWYGNYCDHVLSFLKHEKRENILLITYEKLIKNRKEEILKIAKFLGEEYYEDLKGDETILDKIVEHTAFEYMKKNFAMVLPEWSNGKAEEEKSSEFKDREVNYFRKGTVGDGKKSLTEAQLLRLREHVTMKMRGTHLLEEWFPKE